MTIQPGTRFEIARVALEEGATQYINDEVLNDPNLIDYKVAVYVDAMSHTAIPYLIIIKEVATVEEAE